MEIIQNEAQRENTRKRKKQSCLWDNTDCPRYVPEGKERGKEERTNGHSPTMMKIVKPLFYGAQHLEKNNPERAAQANTHHSQGAGPVIKKKKKKKKDRHTE